MHAKSLVLGEGLEPALDYSFYEKSFEHHPAWSDLKVNIRIYELRYVDTFNSPPPFLKLAVNGMYRKLTAVYSASTPAAFNIFAITGDSARIVSSTLLGVLCCVVTPSLA